MHKLSLSGPMHDDVSNLAIDLKTIQVFMYINTVKALDGLRIGIDSHVPSLIINIISTKVSCV